MLGASRRDPGASWRGLVSPFGLLFTKQADCKYFLVGGGGTVMVFSETMNNPHPSNDYDVYSLNMPTLQDSLFVCIPKNEKVNFGLLIETLEKFPLSQTNNDSECARIRLLFASVVVYKLQNRINFELFSNFKEKSKYPVIYRYMIVREAIASSQQSRFPPEELFRILFHLFLEIIEAKIPLHSFPRDVFGLHAFCSESLFDLVNIMDRVLYPEEDLVTNRGHQPSEERTRMWEWILRVCHDLVHQPHWKEVIRQILLYSVDQHLVVTQEHETLISGLID